METYSLPPDLRIHKLWEPQSWPGSWDMTQWLPKLQKAWDNGVTGEGVKVAVDDTGVGNHPDLPTPVAQRSFVGGSPGDRNGHGTWCAGRILGRNGVGIAPKASLINCKVLSDSGSGSSSGINQARIWASEQGADLISESLGGPQGSQEAIRSIEKAYENGVQVCRYLAG